MCAPLNTLIEERWCQDFVLPVFTVHLLVLFIGAKEDGMSLQAAIALYEACGYREASKETRLSDIPTAGGLLLGERKPSAIECTRLQWTACFWTAC